MRVAGFDLAYCSNIHPGESWDQISTALSGAMPRVRELLGVTGPMGIGLRLSAAAATTLESPARLAAFRAFLSAGDYYVFTINGFPYGAFHGERVKENVYLPDWRDPLRVEYSNRLARLSLEFSDESEFSISTVPGAFREVSQSPQDAEAIAAGYLRHAAALRQHRQHTGRTIILAIEPEPACFIETVDEAVTFFCTQLFRLDAVGRVARETGVTLTVEDVRRHIGVCLDTCHMAVEFEDPAAAFDRLSRAGIRVGKVQITSALRSTSRPGRAVLARFANDTYLHQVVKRGAGGLVRYTDLPDALQSTDGEDEEWRVHFHVPIFVQSVGELETTQPYVAEVLSLLKQNRACRHLEVETYTWDVLPPEYRTDDTCSAIARELEWVRRQLNA